MRKGYGNPIMALTLALSVLLLAIVGNGHVYTGDSIGIAWNWGGVEVLPSAGVFLCEGSYNGNVVTPNPLAIVFPDLVADC